MKKHSITKIIITPLLVLMAFLFVFSARTYAATESSSVGLTGTISAPPPTTPASITFPTNGQ
jgi:uncharacterized MnhB-related membrane protein